VFDAFLTDKVTVRRATGRSVSGTGNAQESWATVKANVPASIQQRSTFYQTREQGQNNATQWKGYFHGNEDIRINDEIVTANGRTYKVHSVYNLGVHQQVELEPHKE
jgi:hypothetical protein